MRNILLLFGSLMFSSAAISQLPKLEPIVYDSSATTGYYFLWVNMKSHPQLILDRFGNIVYYKCFPAVPFVPGINGFDFNLQPNGLMDYTGMNTFYLMDSTFRVIDSVGCKKPCHTDYHDFRILPDGHFLLLGLETDTMDLSAYPKLSLKNGKPGLVLWTIIEELDTARNIVFQWNAKDHFTISDVDSSFGAPRVVTIVYANSVEKDMDGNYLISARSFSQVIKISRKDGSIIWKMGGKDNQFKFINCSTPFYGQHDVRRIGNGHITLFDGANNANGHGARALEFELDEVNKIAALKWSYTMDSAIVSQKQGSVQRLDNSKTLINYGIPIGKIHKVVFALVDSMGSKLFQLNSNNHVSAYRAYNYPSLPWQLHRPVITCFDSMGVKYLDAGPKYASYKWSNDSTSRTIAVKTPGRYHVFVPYGDGGYISSEDFVVTDVSKSCNGSVAPADKKPAHNKRKNL